MTLSARMQRFLVLGPTMALSIVLDSYGYPALPRLFVCLGLAALLISLIALYRHRRFPGATSIDLPSRGHAG